MSGYLSETNGSPSSTRLAIMDKAEKNGKVMDQIEELVKEPA